MYPQRWIQILQFSGICVRCTLVDTKQLFNTVSFINFQSSTFLQTFLTYSSHILAITSNLRCFKSFICDSLLVRRTRNTSRERHRKTMATCIPPRDTVHRTNLNGMSSFAVWPFLSEHEADGWRHLYKDQLCDAKIRHRWVGDGVQRLQTRHHCIQRQE
jgi:hypothetical protein